MKKYLKYCAVLGSIGILIFLYYFYYIKPIANIEREYKIVSIEDGKYMSKEDLQNIRIEEQNLGKLDNEVVGFWLMLNKSADADPMEMIHIEFVDSVHKKTIEEWNLEVGGITDGHYREFRFKNPIEINQDAEYQIKIESYNLSKVSVAISQNTDLSHGKLYLDNQEYQGSMVFKLMTGNTFLKPVYAIFSGIIIITTIIMLFMFYRNQQKTENYLLVLGLGIGSVFILLFPPNTAPDEHAHMATVYRNVNQMLFKDALDENGNVYVRKTDLEVENLIDVSLHSEDYYFDRISEKTDEERVLYNLKPIKVPFFAHLPQTIGVALGWLFQCNGIVSIYLGKITALLFYLACCYFSVKIIPWGKMILTTIALLPMSMEMATSFSYDCTVNALCFLFIAYTIYLIYEKQSVSWKDYLFLGVIAAWMAPCKIAYVFVCGIVFAIPRVKSKNAKWVLGAKFGVVFIGVLIVLLSRITLLNGLIDSSSSTYINVETGMIQERGIPLSKILGDPVYSMGMVFNTLLTQSEQYLGNMFGRELGWLQVKISWIYIIGFIIILLWAVIADQRPEMCMNSFQRWLIAILSMIMLGGIVLSMWLDFTPEGINFIAGVQGRYFLPFLPMLCLSLKNRAFKVEKNMEFLLIFWIFALHFMAFLDIWKYVVA